MISNCKRFPSSLNDSGLHDSTIRVALDEDKHQSRENINWKLDTHIPVAPVV